MIPREIFNYAASRGATHLPNDFRMSMQMLQSRCDCIDITRFHDNSFDTITDDVAGLARCDLWQGACGSFVCHLGASLPLRWKNMNRSLVKIIFRVAHKSHYPYVIAPELFKKRLRFVMNMAHEPQLRVGQIEAMPCFEHMLDTFALNQCPGKHSSKFYRLLTRLEAFHIYASGQIKKFFFRKTAYAKGVGRLL